MSEYPTMYNICVAQSVVAYILCYMHLKLIRDLALFVSIESEPERYSTTDLLKIQIWFLPR